MAPRLVGLARRVVDVDVADPEARGGRRAPRRRRAASFPPTARRGARRRARRRPRPRRRGAALRPRSSPGPTRRRRRCRSRWPRSPASGRARRPDRRTSRRRARDSRSSRSTPAARARPGPSGARLRRPAAFRTRRSRRSRPATATTSSGRRLPGAVPAATSRQRADARITQGRMRRADRTRPSGRPKGMSLPGRASTAATAAGPCRREARFQLASASARDAAAQRVRDPPGDPRGHPAVAVDPPARDRHLEHARLRGELPERVEDEVSETVRDERLPELAGAEQDVRVRPDDDVGPRAVSLRASDRWTLVGQLASSRPQWRKTTTVSLDSRASRTARTSRCSSFAEARPSFAGPAVQAPIRWSSSTCVAPMIAIRWPFTVTRCGA